MASSSRTSRTCREPEGRLADQMAIRPAGLKARYAQAATRGRVPRRTRPSLLERPASDRSRIPMTHLPHQPLLAQLGRLGVGRVALLTAVALATCVASRLGPRPRADYGPG